MIYHSFVRQKARKNKCVPSMIPGKSRSWILDPLCSMTPGIHVNVVNSYDAWALSVLVIVLSKVD